MEHTRGWKKNELPPQNRPTENGWSWTLEKRTLVIADSVESISQIPTRLVKRLRGGSFFSFVYSIFFTLSLPVFSITAPFCHGHGSKWPPSLWPSITGHNHLRQVLRYSNKHSPQCCLSSKVPLSAPKWPSWAMIACRDHSWLSATGWSCTVG